MPRRRFAKLPPDAKERLLGVARRHFARSGFERASLNEILAEAEFSKGSYYYYFEDKDDLFAAVLEAASDEMLARLPRPELAAVSPRAFWPTVERLVRDWGAALDPTSEVFKVAVQMTEEQRRSPRFAGVLAKAQTLFRELVETGRSKGCVRDDLPVDALVRLLEANDAALDAVFFARGEKLGRAAIERHVALVFDTFRRLLEVRAPARARRARG